MRIIHCLRAPVGGLFRHVRDLAREQAARGHEVGVVCDSNASDALSDSRLDAMRPWLSLGLHKVSMSRDVGFADVSATRHVIAIAREQRADIIHGHGAKGGVYARLAACVLSRAGAKVGGFYTPHGGSLHYDPRSLKGRFYMTAERMLLGLTDGLLFESAYSARVFAEKVAAPRCATRVAHNGVLAEELESVAPRDGATDLLFIGELRHLKGVDVLLEAVAKLRPQQTVTVTIVGAGPDAAGFKTLAHKLELDQQIRFLPPMPAREAFALGRILVVPSRAESLPYVVLEGAAAGLPLIASNVGGIPEILGADYPGLVPAGDASRLADTLARFIAADSATSSLAASLRQKIADRFSAETMTTTILAFYAHAPAVVAPIPQTAASGSTPQSST